MYKLVDEGKWTFDKMNELARRVVNSISVRQIFQPHGLFFGKSGRSILSNYVSPYKIYHKNKFNIFNMRGLGLSDCSLYIVIQKDLYIINN